MKDLHAGITLVTENEHDVTARILPQALRGQSEQAVETLAPVERL
ncbi:MAG TPA: hypothetical protein VF614_04110 [Chthoniobacteraceae bacterium]|jgi:hypothetical protein